MPSTRQRASEGHQTSPGKTKLSFREKLVQKGSSTDALLKKLKALHTELAEMDQELVDVSSLSNVKKDLITHHILHHKDRGVRAYAACCLADILRLYAPDAPFTQPELRDIFQFFFRQLSTGMKSGPESAYYDQYFHLLESLSTVKSVVLVCDLPNADEVMVDIFKDFFALVRSNFAKKIELFMADILVAIIDEAQTIPENLLDLILAQFMDKDAKIEQPAYRLAVQVCNETSDKLQRHVSLYFSEILLSHTETEAAEDKDIRNAHELIKRLHASCPGLLHSVIPQLEEELQMSSPHLRSLAVQALGDMFADKNGGELWKNFPTTWQVWLSRGNDKSTVVRVKFVESSKGLYSSTLVEMREALENTLNPKLLDPEEKVRAAVCKLYSELDYETAAHHVSMKQLEAVIARVADKKVVVRHEAAMSIAKLYNLAQPEIENNDPIAVEKFSWIPGRLIGMVNLTECRPVIERAFAEHILPLPSPSSKNSTSSEIDEVAWTNRLLGTICYVSEKMLQQGFLHLTGLRSVHPTSYEVYIETCIANNGGVIDENEEIITRRLRGIIQVISAQFPDPVKTSEDLNTFAKNNDKRLYKLLKTACSIDTDLKSLIKASSEFSKRIDAGLLPTFKTFLYKASLHVVNTSSVPTLLKAIQHPYQNQNRRSTNARTKSVQAAEHAKMILQWISKFCPALYKPHVERLVEVVEDEGEAEGEEGGVVEAALQALAAVVRVDPTLTPNKKESIARARELALSRNWRHAKFATRFLAFCEGEENEGVCGALAEEIAESLDLGDEPRLVAHITALGQLVQFAPNAFESKSDVITRFLLKKLLIVPSPSLDDDMDDGEEWCEDAVLPDLTRAKVTALKVFRHRSLSHKDKPNALELSTPVLKMLATLLDQEGSLAPDANQDRKVLSRMRLQAAVSLVHLSTVERYADALAPKFLKLALIVQDACFEVRLGFVQKLVKLMALHRLPDRFYVIPFLTAHDPEEEVKSYAMTYVVSQLRRLSPTMRVRYFDMSFIRLLHLLAHHPDYPEVITKNTLSDISLYLIFYIDLVANAETVSLLYHLALKGKTVQDAEGDPYSENLYVLCEIAQEFLKARAHQKGWNVTSYPGKVKLPADILRPLPSAEVVNKVVKTTYLPEEAGPWVKELVEPQKEKRERKAPKRKAPATTNGQAKRTRKRKRRSAMSDDDEEEDAVSSDVDVEMAGARSSSPEPDDEEEEPSGDEEELGRGARGRAKAKAKRKAKTKTKVQKAKDKAKDDSPPLSPLSDE